MSLVKDIYSPSFYRQIAEAFYAVHPNFNREQFIERIYVDKFHDLEWKQRVKHTTEVLAEFLPDSFPQSALIITQAIEKLRANGISGGLEHIIFPDYIETYGLDDFEVAVDSFELITKFISCEFAVRPFIIKYKERMMDVMVKWSTHENPHVRRLASEGSRPRLPWAMAIPFLKIDPSQVLPILKNLKNDPSETVRRSVANNLNDIAKDNPEVVITIAQQWIGVNKNTDAIVKHGSRTLLKQGHPKILALYGLESTGFEVANLRIATPEVKIGDSLSFSFTVKNVADKAKILRLEYGIYYRKANGLQARKVFKISEKMYAEGEENTIERSQSFKLITTRKFYVGKHKVSILINGEETLIADFDLIAAH